MSNTDSPYDPQTAEPIEIPGQMSLFAEPEAPKPEGPLPPVVPTVVVVAGQAAQPPPKREFEGGVFFDPSDDFLIPPTAGLSALVLGNKLIFRRALILCWGSATLVAILFGGSALLGVRLDPLVWPSLATVFLSFLGSLVGMQIRKKREKKDRKQIS